MTKRHPLNMRTTEDVRSALERAAAQSGRSLAQEVEFRLEQSFREERALEQVLHSRGGDPLNAQTAGFLAVLTRVIRDTAEQTAFASGRTLDAVENWLSNPYAFEQVSQAIRKVLEVIRPAGEPALPRGYGGDPELRDVAKFMGIGFANSTLEAIANDEREGEIGEWAKPVREKLGKTVRSRIGAWNQERRSERNTGGADA